MPKEHFFVSGITARLFRVISRMPESKQHELMTMIGEERAFERKPYMMALDYKTESRSFRDFILDISPAGVFIETSENFETGQNLTMTFEFRNRETPFQVSGKVAWKSSNGMGVKFLFTDKSLQDELILLLKDL